MAAATFFILLFLTLSSTIHARESQFFAKISNNIPKETQPLNTNQQDPNFVPQTQPDGGAYGLYGHESGQLPPSSTANNLPTNLPENYNPVSYTTPIHSSTQDFPNELNDAKANLPENYNPVAYTTPIHSSTQDFPNEVNDPKEYQFTGNNGMYNSENQEMSTNGGDMYNSENKEMGVKFGNAGDTYDSSKQEMGTNGGNMYNYQKQGMSDTRFMENGRYYYSGSDGYKSQKPQFDETRFMETEDGGNTYNSQEKGSEDTYNSEKQGMSDTRFLEDGKYYYDLNLENSRAFDSRNGYNTNGYNGNNYKSYDRYNSNGGYQNQEDFQDNQFNP